MKKYLYSIQSDIFQNPEISGFGNDYFNVNEISKEQANKIIIKNHYSKKVFNLTKIHLGVFKNNELIGVIQYGYAMNPQSMGSLVKGTNVDEYLELNRMWFDDRKEKNDISKAISYSIKFIKKKFHKIKWIQSFADARCNKSGIVYQACNFKYYGSHFSEFYELEGNYFHKLALNERKGGGKNAFELRKNIDKAIKLNLEQFRYIYFIDKREEKNCLLKEQSFRKYYNDVINT